MSTDIGPGTLVVFEGRYVPEPNSGCWLWISTVNEKGYGIIQRKQYRGFAHRFSFFYHHGPLPVGHEVCHKCDTPSCVNPDHLYAGTRADNMRDCIKRKRHPSQNGFDYAKGEDHPAATLTNDEVRTILALRGTATWREIANRFGTTRPVIKRIMLGKTWKHIDRSQIQAIRKLGEPVKDSVDA